MAGKRMIHSNICESKKLSAVSYAAETLYYRLLSRVDDDGNFTAEPRLVLGQCMPFREDQDADMVEEMLQELSTVTDGDKQPLISFYTSGGDRYLHINRFQEFQYLRPDRTAVAVCPTHPQAIENSTLTKRKDDGLPVAFNSHQPQSGGRYTKDGLPHDESGLPLAEMVGSNQINVKSNQNKSNHDAGDFKNLKVRYRKAFNTRLSGSKNTRQKYTEACQRFSEETVLEMFEHWAEGASWIKNLAADGKLYSDGLNKFYDQLPELIEEESTWKNEQVAAQSADSVREADIARQLEEGHAQFLKQKKIIQEEIDEEDAATLRIQRDPNGFFGTTKG
jgi:hypothetical protein